MRLLEKEVTESIRRFYDNEGWVIENDNTTRDAYLNEDLRSSASEYVSKCRERVSRYIPKKGEHFLDMASGPIQYPEYLDYSRNYTRRHCVDLSSRALEMAEEKIGQHGEYHNGDFLSLEFKDNFFDCCLCCHALYHIHRDSQKEAVEKLLRICRNDGKVIIIYSNPDYILQKIIDLFRKRRDQEKSGSENFYHYSHPLRFWKQFEGMADISLYPWRSMSARHQKILFPDNALGKLMFRVLYRLEDLLPSFFVRFFKFHTVVLTPRRKSQSMKKCSDDQPGT